MVNILKQFNDIDLSKNWVSVHKTKDGNIELVLEKKVRWKERLFNVISFITFGLFSKDAGFLKVAKAIHDLKLSPQSNADITDATIQQSIIKLEGLGRKTRQTQSAIKVFRQTILGDDLFKVKGNSDIRIVIQSKYKSISETENDVANRFIFTPDNEGKTFFHHWMNLKENPQVQGENGLLWWRESLGSDLFKTLMHQPDNKGQTPIAIALERGHIGVFASLYPIDKNNAAAPNPSAEANLTKHIAQLCKTLSNPTKRNELMEKCAEGTTYQKLNQILSSMHRLVCNGYGPALCNAIDKLSSKESSHLPQSLLRLKNYYENNPTLEKFKSLKLECESLSTEEEIDKKMTEWQYTPTPREESYIPFKNMQSDAEPRLFYMVRTMLTENDPAKQNAYYNMLQNILNPFEAYDSKIDFTDSQFADTLHRLVDIPVDFSNNSNLQNDLKSITQMLILKYPNFVTNVNSSKKKALQYLQEKNNENAKIIMEAINEILPTLNEKLFENLVKKDLKYRLEEKGKKLSA